MKHNFGEAGGTWFAELRPRIHDSEKRLLARLTADERSELLRLMALLAAEN